MNPRFAATASMLCASVAFADRGDFNGDTREALKHGWILNYQDGLDQALKLRKPMMLVFRCVP
jgi:hypothetical protein